VSRTSLGDALRHGLGIYPPAPKAPEPKVFGLKEASSSMQYLKDVGPQGAKVVMAVLMGALGYVNTVGRDVEAEVGLYHRAQAKRSARVMGNQEQVNALLAENVDLTEDNKRDDHNIAMLKSIAETFGG